MTMANPGSQLRLTVIPAKAGIQKSQEGGICCEA